MLDKKINKAISYIVRCEECAERLDSKINELNKKYSLKSVSFVILWISLFMIIKSIMIGTPIFVLSILTLLLLNANGWRKSVKKWLFLTVGVDSLFIFMILVIILPRDYQEYKYIGAICLYFILWTFFSLLAVSNISKLVNEIITSIAATLFTIGTFLITLYSPNYTEIEQKYEYINQNIDKVSKLELLNFYDNVFKYIGFKIANGMFLILLPIISISALCVVLVNIKQYWMSKYEIYEVGEQEEGSCTWVYDRLGRYKELMNLFTTDNEFLLDRIKYNNTTEEISTEYINTVLKDFQKLKRDIFFKSIEINTEISKPIYETVDIKINIAKIIEEIDKLSLEYKVSFYGNLVRSAYFENIKMKAEDFEDYYLFIKKISIQKLKLLKGISEYCHYLERKIFNWDEFRNSVKENNSEEKLENFRCWIENEKIVKKKEEDTKYYFLTNYFLDIDRAFLLAFEDKMEGNKFPLL